MSDPVALKRAEIPAVHPLRMSQAEGYKRNIWHLDVDVAVQPDDMVNPAYWAHVAQMLRPFDRIEAHAEDGSWFAEFLVRDAGVNWAKVALLRKNELEAVSPERRGVLLPGYAVKWAGNFAKWRIVRESDNKVLFDKIPTEGDAYTKLADFARTLSQDSARQTVKE